MSKYPFIQQHDEKDYITKFSEQNCKYMSKKCA